MDGVVMVFVFLIGCGIIVLVGTLGSMVGG